MKTFKQILDEARMVATGDYRISASGRKVRRLIKIGDDDYNRADDTDKDGDIDADDMKKMKKMARESVQLEQIDDVTWYDGSDMLGEAQERYSSSYQFTHKPGDEESEKKLSDLKKSVKGTGKRVVLQGRLGKNNPNAHKYSKAVWGKPGSASSGAHTHQRIRKADAAHHDVYVYDKADTQYDADTISEAVTVKKDNYSWGKMVTVHHGADTSYPLHPEHQSLIKKLKDGEHASFTDETNRKVNAHREGDNVHLSSKGTSKKTTVAHSHFNEAAEIQEGGQVAGKEQSVHNQFNKSDVPAYLRKKTGDKLTTQDLEKERTKNRSHPETLKKINGTNVKESFESLEESKWEKTGATGLAKDFGEDGHVSKTKKDITVRAKVHNASHSDGAPVLKNFGRKEKYQIKTVTIPKGSKVVHDKSSGNNYVHHPEHGHVEFEHDDIQKKEGVEYHHDALFEAVEEPPFDKPYKKVESDTVTDKSGAKHGPMSRARNLARIAIQQQSKKTKK